MPITEINIEQANQELAGLDASSRVSWAVEAFGDGLVMSTSFGVQAAVMLHLVTQIKPDVPVIFVDTGYLFEETYRFADALTERLGLNLKVYNPLMTAARQEALYGKRWEQDEKALAEYNLQNKVEPMNRAVRELGAVGWMSGLRREQSSTRKRLDYLSLQKKTYKIHPIIDWNSKDIYHYLTKHDLPYHPLWEKGYVSIGDWHSTQSLQPGMTEEQTRFGGVKRECGLHEATDLPDYQI